MTVSRRLLLRVTVAVALLAVAVAIVVSTHSPRPATTAEPLSRTPPIPTIVLDDTQKTAQHAVNTAVAMDGIPVDWATVGTDAYGWVTVTCGYLANYPGGPLAVNWRDTPIPGLMTRGGMAALVAGAPTVCPGLARFIDSSAEAFFPGL